MSSIQGISISIALLFFLQIVYLTSKHKLQDQQGFFWMMMSLLSFFVALSIPWLNQFASFIGISYMPSLIFLIAFIVVLNILMYQNTVLSKQQEKLKSLIQEVAFLKKEIEDSKRSERGNK